jgi:hypothetical protein
MTLPRPTFRRRILAGLVPLLIAAGALPLLAPTCGSGGEGWKAFSRNSLIIPMDVCYQSQGDGSSRSHTYTPASCPGAQDPGNVIKAYGLVYQLIRNNIAVYWVIDQGKTALTDYDLTVQYNGGFPVLKYNWSTGLPGAAPATNADHTVRYRGGPFIIDGSDYDRAVQVLRSYQATFGPAGGSGVNIHVSNVAFRGYAKKTMAGGWSAGGAIPPKLAMLDIGSGNINKLNPDGTPASINDPKNAQPVIGGYLTEAGIGSGAAVGSATGTHGEIYDKLGIEDFQPAAGSSDAHTSNLFKNGYQILWVPHWVAPGSCSNPTSANCLLTLYSEAKIAQVLKTIGVFVAEGGDLFGECASIGSFEGAFKRGNTGTGASSYTIDYQDGDPTTRFQTTLGVRYNELSTSPFAAPAYPPGNFGSPLMQLGDYAFSPVTGAVEDYRPQDTTSYQPNTTRLITSSGSTANWDFFSVRPPVTGNVRGTIVYLAGHSYSGVQGSFQIAGSRLVLNTLFNLGSACTASGVTCDTGKLGVCGRGVIQCVGDQQSCVQTGFPSAEICDGLDNDCNGLVDDMDSTCYDGPAGTQGVGLCTSGVRSCQQQPDGSYAMSACVGEVLPTSEICNGLDDNCNGQADESLYQDCYYGPSSSLDPTTGVPQGICKAGRQVCTLGSWGTCAVCTGSEVPGSAAFQNCQVLPRAEVCPSALDENCDGQVNESTGEGCGVCTPGATAQCYTGPAGTVNVGVCHYGSQTCSAGGSWGPCLGQAVPTGEVCSPASCTTEDCKLDENCNGQKDEGCGCQSGQTQACYTGPAGTAGKGVCRAGHQVCDAGAFGGSCLGEVQPTPETCDGQDNDCDGVVDDGATCATGFTCEHGVCAPDSCGVESPCPEGYRCGNDGTGTIRCLRDACGGATCPDGAKCDFGVCVQLCPGPDEESVCWPGAYCQSGGCVGGGCYYEGCPTGQLCMEGACQPDPCSGVACPTGTFCRQGDCVQSCVYVDCATGQKCGVDGFCEADPCAAVAPTCGATQKCVDGSCVEDTCLGKGCGPGQVCVDQVCVDDPCNGVECGVGACVGGQCFAVGNPDEVIYDPPSNGQGSCGCGPGAASPLSALPFLLLVPLARRRRKTGRGGRGALALALVAAALLGSACNKKGGTFDPGTCSGGGTVCGEACVDVYTDPSNCGGCGFSCSGGQQCVDKACGPTSAVAPQVTAVTPSEGDQGQADPVSLQLAGVRFADGATVRVTSSRGTDSLVTTFVDSNHLTAALDLSEADPSTIYVRVVNPNRVISNALPFDVVTPTPHVSSISPTSIVTGGERVVTLSGTGFLAGTRCYLSGPNLSDTVIPTTRVSATELQCAIDATGLLPSPNYFIWAVTSADPTALISNKVSLPVDSQTPVLTDVSPNQGETGSVASFVLGGSGFDVTSVTLWDGAPLVAPAGTTLLDSSHLYVTQVSLPAAAGTHTVSVRNGTSAANYVTSGTLQFIVGGAPPAVTTFSPASAYQGDVNVTLHFTGSGFPSGTVIQLQAPGGGWTSLTTSWTATEVTATVSFNSGQAAGDYLVRLLFPGGATSSAQTFRLLSNQAILQSATPRGAAQGASTPVTMRAANLRPSGGASPYGIRVRFNGAYVTPSSVTPATGTVVASIGTVGLQTGTYTLQVTNPNGAADSNPLSFNVTPGMPTLTPGGVSPITAPIQDAEVVITLTGTNFATPDAGDNGGSTVHISAPSLGVTDYAIASSGKPVAQLTLPYARVLSATSIAVHLDTRDAIAGSYDVAVWNPGSLNPPQKSNTLSGAFTVTP